MDLFSGVGDDAYVLINSSRDFDQLGLGEFVQRFRPEHLLTVPATEMAREHFGRPLPNAALLGGFAALSGVVSIDSVAKAIRDKFSGKVADRNVRAAEAARDYVAARDGRADPCVGRRRAHGRWPRPSGSAGRR